MTRSSDQADLWLGSIRFAPSGPITAGSFGTYQFSYRAGRYGIDNGGTIKIAVRLASDWGRPQLSDPSAEGYTTVRTSAPVALRAYFDPRGWIRPFSGALTIEISDEALAEGDEVVGVWGDTSRGGPGCRAQTFVDPGFEFRVLVDCFGTQEFRRLPSSPIVEVTPGPVTRLVLTAPSIVTVGGDVVGTLRSIDCHGNPVPGVDWVTALAVEGGPEAIDRRESSSNGVVRWSGLRFRTPGVRTVIARDPSGQTLARSNPIDVKADAPPWRLCWGDTQGQSGATVGTGEIDEFFRYARDVAGLDFVVHSGNDFQITDADYAATLEAVRRYHEPGRFVTFPSFEWSGNTPGGGDHNIIYLSDDDAPLYRSSQWLLADAKDDGTDRYPLSALWETLRGRADVIAVPHVGGRYSNFDYFDPAFCPIVEITSVHGRFNWFAEDAIRRGLRIGIVGATDDHSGRPGASAPTAQPAFGHHGGLAAVYATSNTREALFDAMRARRCYGTTGPRILLWTEMGGCPMGSECQIDGRPRLRVRMVGTAPLEWVEIARDVDVVHRRFLRPPAVGSRRRLRVAWSGARLRGRGRPTRWDGGLSLKGGVIRSASPWGFEIPGQGITQVDEYNVSWRSTTAGDPDGVELDLDAGADAVVSFQTGPASFSVALAALESGPHVVSAGGVEQRVEMSWVSVDFGPTELEFEWIDEAARPGTHAYWVRLLQSDTHAAWSSPIYATVGD